MKGHKFKSVSIFLLIVLLALVFSGLPYFSGFLSLRASILVLVLGIIFALLYLHTGAKKYLFILIGLSIIIVTPVALPVDYPLCGINGGIFSNARYDCTCAGLTRGQLFGVTQCVGVRLSCYTAPLSSNKGLQFAQYGDMPVETDARAYFDKEARSIYKDYTGELNLRKELMTGVTDKMAHNVTDRLSVYCSGPRNSGFCEKEYPLSSSTEIVNFTDWFAQIGISCGSLDSRRYGD